MWMILLEALGALLILVLIVWWTMFSGRRGGERIVAPPVQAPTHPPADFATGTKPGRNSSREPD